jgi:hypothetical protein
MRRGLENEPAARRDVTTTDTCGSAGPTHDDVIATPEDNGTTGTFIIVLPGSVREERLMSIRGQAKDSPAGTSPEAHSLRARDTETYLLTRCDTNLK